MAMQAAADSAPMWEMAKGIMLFATTATLAWCAKALREVLRTLVEHQHILVGVDGTNGLRGQVRSNTEDIEDIKERNWKIDAVVEAERQQWPHPDRREGSRRLRDVTHDVLDERAKRRTDEHPTEG